MPASIIRNVLVLIVIVGAYFAGLRTGQYKPPPKTLGGNNPSVRFCSGMTNFPNGKQIDYDLFTINNGVSWWAIKKDKSNKWTIAGTAEEVYPGLVALLNDKMHAEIELMQEQIVIK
jgi:hypothetical protein